MDEIRILSDKLKWRLTTIFMELADEGYLMAHHITPLMFVQALFMAATDLLVGTIMEEKSGNKCV